MSTSGGSSGGLSYNPETYYTGPAGGTLGYCAAETAPRSLFTSGATLGTSGTLLMAAVYIAQGTPVTKLAWMTGDAVGITSTHQWLGLYDSNRNQLAVTADQGSAPIALATFYQYPIATTAAGAATSFTTTYSGLYYIGYVQVAATPAAYASPASFGGQAALFTIPPIIYGSSDTGQTTPPGFPHTATALTALAQVPYLSAA